MRKSSLWLLAVTLISIGAPFASAQIRVVGPGSTVAGDTLRGEGVYLQGLGWYELNEAKAMAVNADSMMKMEKWNQELQAAYRREYNAAVERKNYRTKQAYDEAQKQHDERERLLRTNPTPEDIEKGDALNALLTDLSAPTIQESSWRGAKVPLPDDISIKALAFQFAPKSGAKENAALTTGLIALGRLDTKGRWPDIFPLAKLNVEIPAYEAGYRKVVDQSLAGRLELDTVLQMDDSIKALRNKVGVVVPTTRGFRSQAIRFVDNLAAATKMFDASTLPFAREMIADTNKHEAHTVGELLAFMRKYRLKFATADASPGGEEMYSRLYGLLRQQVEALGLKSDQGLPRQEEALGLQSRPADLGAAGPAESPGFFKAKVTSGAWSIDHGEIVQSSTNRSSGIIFGEPSWSHYDFRYTFRIDSGKEANWTFINYRDGKNHKNLYAGGFGNTLTGIGVVVDGAVKRSHKPISFAQNRWYTVMIEVRGSMVRWYIDSNLVLEHQDERLPQGKIGLGTYNTAVRFRNLQVSTPDGKILIKGLPALNP